MKPGLLPLLAVSLLPLGATAQSPKPASPPPAAQAIAAAERAFAAQALQEGNKAAFLATMADSAVVFSRAEPALARSVWSGRPAATPTDPSLRWGPATVGAAASGELGYSTGPWYLQQPDGQRVTYGQFFTIWARQPDGRYRWLLDNGISHPAPAGSPEPPATLSYPAAGQPPRRGSTDVLRTATALDEQLSAATAAQGLAPAYTARLHPQARLLREGIMPLTTPAAIRQQLDGEAPRQLLPAGGRIARSGELAYTYGTYQNSGAGQPGRGSYVHLWQHGAKGWQLLAEVCNPAPQ
ncbi:Cif family virulence factor [Hymenobacter jeollabukensis]|uniref:DUF4440 domain-containing protein n=1 Tax=Hymenobacter jeollabukensis TaxID=2025313 RepID=A0A5R8WXZ3_9BACT|nr:DUF4440 domain-containing protein [Hymenobacter jeollabukensis]TLM97015.1 hypothetical protein FDY95_03225 [Hymenobacter jeollabukensis]